MTAAAGIALTPEFVERGYNNRAAVPDHPRWIEHYATASAATRIQFSPQLDVRYGYSCLVGRISTSLTCTCAG